MNPAILHDPEPAALATLRRGLLAILLFAMGGNIIELFLLEHTEDWKQWTPIVALAAGGILVLWCLVRPGRAALRSLALLMVVFIAAGIVGTWFHYRGNVEFEIERTPELGGLALFRAAMEGATPALAPGTMIQFGLIGLLFTWRHPAWRDRLPSQHTP